MTRGGRVVVRRARLIGLASITAAGVIGLAGCVSGNPGGGESSPPQSSANPSVSVQPNTEHVVQSRVFMDSQATLRLDVLSLARFNSQLLKLKLKVSTLNESSTLSNTFGNDYDGVSLIDGKGMKAYFVSQSKDGEPLMRANPDTGLVDSGEPRYLSMYFPSPPASVTKLNINYPAGPPFIDVPIQGTARVEQGEPDPTKSTLKTPRVEDLLNSVDDLSGDKSTDEGKNGVDIRLNTDVLFALNKATLTDKAQSTLKDVAERIDQASSKAIKVDGYTDNSGNDAINDPLSRRRAAAVTKELKKLVTRSGVTFQSAGHGSKDPIATNDTSEGRQKNRRVTVTIGK